MNHLNRSILEDYGIEKNAPERVCAVQFGDDALLMGLVDRLIDDANRSGANVGLAVVQPGSAGFAAELKAQDGMYTVFVRGEQNEKNVRREQVVQSVLKALEPEADDEELMALARSGDVRFAILNEDATGEFAARNAVNSALAARFLVERRSAGLPGMAVIVCGDDAACAETVKARILETAQSWKLGAEFGAWLEECRFFPALADCLTMRSDALEAAQLCTEMNYADAMIHLAEPYGLWAIQADEAFREEFPLDGQCAQIRFVESVAETLELKHRLFDAGLCVMAAMGGLHGNATLADCMKDEALRERIGHAFYDEILPFAPGTREAAAAYVIESCERYGNPMNENVIPEAAAGLIRKFCVGVIPAMKAYANENFEPPKVLSMALAATAMLYSRVRWNGEAYEINIGEDYWTIHDAPETLRAFSMLAPDMSPDSLTYAVLADRTLWQGMDLREIDGLEDAVQTELTAQAHRQMEENNPV